MFRPMRRRKQQLSEKQAIAALEACNSGVLSLIGDDGYPYGVPLSYVYSEGHIYFHCAKEGHKLDAIRACGKASFTVIAKDDVVPDEFTTYYASVIAFGQVRIIEDGEEKLRLGRLLGLRYNPGNEHATELELDKSAARMHVLDMNIEHMSGKEAIELARMRADAPAND